METIKDKIGNTIEIKLSWCADDVRQVARDEGIRISALEIGHVLDLCRSEHNAETGINWDVIRCHIEYVIGEREATK